MRVLNLLATSRKLTYTSNGITITWNIGKTGPGKAKITGDVPKGVDEWIHKMVNNYVKNWRNDRIVGVEEFCKKANEKGVMGAIWSLV